MYQTDNGWEKQKPFLCAFGSVLNVFFPNPLLFFYYFFLCVAGRGYNKEDAEFLVAFGVNFGNTANK